MNKFEWALSIAGDIIDSKTEFDGHKRKSARVSRGKIINGKTPVLGYEKSAGIMEMIL